MKLTFPLNLLKTHHSLHIPEMLVTLIRSEVMLYTYTHISPGI